MSHHAQPAQPAIELTLRLAPGSALHGELSSASGRTQAFEGWAEMAAAVEALRTTEGDVAPARD